MNLLSLLRTKRDYTKQLRSGSLEVKASDVKPDGTFTGYASVFGEPDSYNEITVKGSFKASLAAWAKKGKLPAMLWMHDPGQVIGKWTSMAEDSYGLLVTGQLALDTPKGAECYALLKMGALDGLSIGYCCTKWTEDTKAMTITLDVIDLWEVSVVTFPAGDNARIEGVKSLVHDGKLPTLQEFEDHLREAGFSKTQATAIAGKGLACLLRQREAESDDRKSIEAVFAHRYGVPS
jgi:HK97 family phage prohead protease